MSESLHQRAQRLIAEECVEGIAAADRDWLESHVRQCAACVCVAQATRDALRSLRGVPVAVPRGLAERTQFRVRLRAQELRQLGSRRRALWLACAMSWFFGVASAPYVWRAFAWFGERTGLPKIVWELSFGLWWTLPAFLAVVVLLMENARRGGGLDWTRLGE